MSPYIKDETVKIQRYLSGLPSFISENIQYDDPKTLEETIRREKCLYDQHKGNPTFQKNLGGQEEVYRGNRGRKGISHPFPKTFLEDNYILESIGWLR
jgi:hypothetical protein